LSTSISVDEPSDMPPISRSPRCGVGQAGSLVLWSWLMSALCFSGHPAELGAIVSCYPWVIVVISFTQSFFLGPDDLLRKPFLPAGGRPRGRFCTAQSHPGGAVAVFPPDGEGLNPVSATTWDEFLHPPCSTWVCCLCHPPLPLQFCPAPGDRPFR